MGLYNDTVMENFMHPKNVGEIENPDGVGIYGSPVCGDMMQMQIKVDENDVITDCKFKTFGCASAIASSSMATSMIIGKTVEEALRLVNLFLEMIKREVTDDDKLEELEDAIALKNISNMPARVKCAVLAWHTLKDALEREEK